MTILLVSFGTAIGLAIMLFLGISFAFLSVRFFADGDRLMAVYSGIVSVSLVVISTIFTLYWVIFR
jgi:hypothetical protein